MRHVSHLGLGLAIAAIGCQSPAPRAPAPPTEIVEATSLLGEALLRPALSDEFVREQLQHRSNASAWIDAHPDDPAGWIWVGRRTAYLGHYREAIYIYSRAIERFPGEPRFYRHRGHRYITVRQLDRAIGDLELAASLVAGTPDHIEPDGLPNARGIPTGTLRTNVYYHLGLARYLRGDFAGARRAYVDGSGASKNPDMQSAMSYWLVLALWRSGAEEEARLVLRTIDPDWEIIENHDYHGMLRAFAGDRDPRELLPDARSAGGVRFATVGYGVGMWLWLQGEQDEAKAIWNDVVVEGSWAAFGRIAAEAELAREKHGSVVLESDL